MFIFQQPTQSATPSPAQALTAQSSALHLLQPHPQAFIVRKYFKQKKKKKPFF